MTIATEIRVVEIKNESIKNDNEDLKEKLQNAEREYEQHLKNMNLEFTTLKTNYEANVDNLQMELEAVKNELDFYRVFFMYFRLLINVDAFHRTCLRTKAKPLPQLNTPLSSHKHKQKKAFLKSSMNKFQEGIPSNARHKKLQECFQATFQRTKQTKPQ